MNRAINFDILTTVIGAVFLLHGFTFIWMNAFEVATFPTDFIWGFFTIGLLLIGAEDTLFNDISEAFRTFINRVLGGKKG